MGPQGRRRRTRQPPSPSFGPSCARVRAVRDVVSAILVLLGRVRVSPPAPPPLRPGSRGTSQFRVRLASASRLRLHRRPAPSSRGHPGSIKGARPRLRSDATTSPPNARVLRRPSSTPPNNIKKFSPKLAKMSTTGILCRQTRLFPKGKVSSTRPIIDPAFRPLPQHLWTRLTERRNKNTIKVH